MLKGKKKFSMILVLLLVVSVLLTACGDGGGEPTSVDGESSEKADKNILVTANMADARTVDPHGAGDSPSVNALLPVVETLVVYDENGEIQPHLAESWEEIDSQTWEFKLKEGVKFHNGEEMKASDVVYSFKRATSPAGARVQYIMRMVDPDGLEIVDDYTVIVRTIEPFTPFISYLPYIGAAIISETAYEKPDAEHHPIGTGPFEFGEWNRGESISYTRFDEYWGEKPKHEQLLIKNIPEANSRLIELETGQADLAINMTVNDKSKLEDHADLQLITSPTTNFTYLGFNTSKTPFDNVKFRQAIDWAVDAEGAVAAVHRDAAIYTPGPITPAQKYFNDSESNDRYDVEKAKQLLEESGVDTSQTFTITVNENQPRIDTATIVQSQLQEIGIKVEIEVMETAAYFDYITTGEQEMYMGGWGAVGFPDPDNNLYGPFHSGQIPENNSSFYVNPELDEMLDRSRQIPDGDEREALMKEIQQIVRDEVPIMTFDNATNLIGIQNYIDDFIAMPTAHQVYNSVIIK